LRARRAVEDLLGGQYHSIFKGTGIAFEEVREYQPGDDIRSIDWNVTARMGHPFVKRFVEERELTLMLLVDLSASLCFGTGVQQKREVAAELAALLAFSALANYDKVGLVLCSDRVERFVPPRKGLRHALRVIRDVLFYEPEQPGTNLRIGLDYLNRVLSRRAIVFLLSDFFDVGFDKAFRRTARRHDLVAVRLADPREAELPDVGLLDLEDAESGQRVLVDTAAAPLRDAWAERGRKRQEHLRQLAHTSSTDLIEVSTDGKHLNALVRFFRMRERRLGHR